MEFHRRAAVNKGLLVVLALMALATVLFYGWKSKSEGPGPPDPDEPTESQLWCDDEQVWITVKVEESAKLERQGDMLKCPKCGKFSASWSQPVAPDAKVLAP